MPPDKTTFNIPKEPAKRRVWVCASLKLKGKSLRQLAELEGVSPQAMGNALMAPSYRLETVIAEALGLDPRKLFPERYDDAGNRIVIVRKPNRTTARQARNVNPAEAV